MPKRTKAKNATTAKRARKATHSKKSGGPFKLRTAEAAGRDRQRFLHVYGDGIVCDTERRGYPTSRGLSPLEIVVDASEGFIPLWVKGTTLRWCFQERSMSNFQNPAA